ncbi:hypothetical protein VNO77_05715 [Canavalia gladiata]|uniref:Uncharacterized protein n=1 Tax=Canavalia gladiata TaxID=3824 RepID=A0AAN9N416_CANGL
MEAEWHVLTNMSMVHYIYGPHDMSYIRYSSIVNNVEYHRALASDMWRVSHLVKAEIIAVSSDALVFK